MKGSARALVLTGPRSIEHRDFELPDLSSGEGRLRIEACGLCGTDHEQYTGHIGARHSFIPGHEVVGVIDAIGTDAAAAWGVEVGQRVAVEVFQSCRECEPCRSGVYRRCVANGLGTMVGFTDADSHPGLGGGYATHLHLGPHSMLLPVPESLGPVEATLFNPLGAGIRWGAELPETKPGDVVVVLGPGIRGLCAAAASKSAGASFVMVTGMGERDRERLELATHFGADVAVDVSVDDPVKVLRSAVGRGADVVVDVTAKAPEAFAQAVRLAGVGARVVVAGTRGSGSAPGFDPDHIVYKELTLIGALGVDVSAYRAAFDMLVERRFPFELLPRAQVGFDGLERLLQIMAGDIDETPPVHGVFVPGDAT